LFVLYTGIAWRHLRLQLGFGSGATCRRRLDQWQQAAVWDTLHELLLARLELAGELECHVPWSKGATCRRKKGAPKPARARLTGAESAPSTIFLVDATGIPLAFSVTGGNRNDVTQRRYLSWLGLVRA
jgi:hypothetical protein